MINMVIDHALKASECFWVTFYTKENQYYSTYVCVHKYMNDKICFMDLGCGPSVEGNKLD